MSGDSFAALIQAEKDAAVIISKARDARREIMRSYETKLEQEVAQYKASEGSRVRTNQGGNSDAQKGQADEAHLRHTLKSIGSQTNANMDAMVKKLVTMVTTVN